MQVEQRQEQLYCCNKYGLLLPPSPFPSQLLLLVAGGTSGQPRLGGSSVAGVSVIGDGGVVSCERDCRVVGSQRGDITNWLAFERGFPSTD